MVGSAAIKQGRSANRKHTYFFFWPHIKRQNLEEKHCRFRSGGSDLQSLQNQLLFYLVLKSLITCIRFYLLNLRCHCYVFACKYYKYLQPV